MTRQSWDETWIGVARVVAQRSLCDRSKVGAVIVSATNRIIATGYNGPPAGYSRAPIDVELGCSAWCQRAAIGPSHATLRSYEDCPSLHAELNALSVCDRSVREGGTIYVTSSICLSCAKAVANSGLQRVVIAHDATVDYRDPATTVEYLTMCGLRVDAFT